METLTSVRLNYQQLLDKPRVYADLNAGWKTGDNYFVPLNSRATQEDLRQLGLSLTPGLAVDFWTDDGDDAGNPDPLLFQGVIQFDEDTQSLVAVTAWSDFRNASELDPPADDPIPAVRSIVINGSVKYDEIKVTPAGKPGAVPPRPLKKS